jgi:glyoxylase-like metal-dependent hydrolase (beta-lactamase superfamily II)/8-oxo-dGTP pyrophosphatase MutT (NUDIX family)
VKEATPKDAAAVILLRENSPEVFLAQRNPKIPFLGGFHAFPGGKVDKEDAEIEVGNCADRELAKFIACAARETFEEVGVLLVRGGDRITKGQRASLRDDLISSRFSFAEILESWGLRIDAEDFSYTGFWTTPKFSPVRFKTRFFLAVCPRKQEPQVFGEFIAGEFIAPHRAVKLWESSEILISPPVLLTLQTLAEFEPQGRGDAEKEINEDRQDLQDKRENAGIYQAAEHTSSAANSFSASLRLCGEKLLLQSQKYDGRIRYVKFHPFIDCFPVRTETLPPATHTNCFIAGGREFVVIDAASPFAEEQSALHEYVDSLIESGNACRALVLTHLHRDHISGARALQNHLREKYNLRVAVAAHKLTAESMKDSVEVERFIEDGEVLDLKIDDAETLRLVALHTPGHARGHLCFYDKRRGFLLSGDNVLAAGSVLIAPPEGDMKDYLASLERMKNLPGLRFLCGSHGAAVFDARGKIEEYIAHRLEREKRILRAIENGAKTVSEIVEQAYADLPDAKLFPLAAKAVAAHLAKLSGEGVLEPDFIKFEQ